MSKSPYTQRMTAQQYRQLQGHKDPVRQYRGKANRDAGKQFEDMIDASCEYYRTTKKAEIKKTPEPMRPLKSLDNGRFIACFEKKAEPDYKGTLKDGRSVVFEAKHTTTGQIEQSRVTREQSDALDRHEAMGAQCFVIVGFGMTEFFKIPWTLWKTMKQSFGRRYIRREDLNGCNLTLGKNGILFFLDWDVQET